MREKLTNDRGQVGIGTLIVFIALVLVAAIAAGVLINTAGFLQTQAEQTGQDSTDQVADNINVIGEVGEVNSPGTSQQLGSSGANTVSTTVGDNVIYENRITVQRSPGSSEIDLTGLSIQYVGDNGFAQLTHVSSAEFTDSNTDYLQSDAVDVGSGSADVAQSVYFVRAITAESDSDAVITADGDRYEIVVPLGGYIKPISSGSAAALVADTGVTVNAGSGDVITVDTYADSDDVETDFVSRLDNGGSSTDSQAEQIDNSALSLMQAGQQAELEITTDAGATRNVVLSAPDTLIDQGGNTVTL